MEIPGDVEQTLKLFREGGYFADRGLAIAVFLGLRMARPIFLEGEAGIGKTEVAKVLAAGLGRRLVRLQCYEGMDMASAVYEWNYARQMVAIRLAEAGSDARLESLEKDIYSDAYLIRRPLLQALTADETGTPVLLIDELDRADEPFEAFLLEVLAEFQITIPEIGTISAEEPPMVIVTSNRTREIHDALKRRCLYFWIDYPDPARELAIVTLKVPGVAQSLGEDVVSFVQELRRRELFKPPGVAESLDWTRALVQLGVAGLDEETVEDTLGVLLKYQDDIIRIRGDETRAILAQPVSDFSAAEI